MIYVRANFIPDSLNSLPEEEKDELSATMNNTLCLNKIVKQDEYKYLKKVENIPFTDSEQDDWLQNRAYYFATRSSRSKGLIYIVMFS